MSKSDKLPAMQFYTGDWRKDPGVQALNYEDRGIWFEMLCLMWESDERGKLMLNGRKIPEEGLARLLGLDNQKLNQTLTTLLTYGVASVEPDTGVIYSRRMVRDEEIRKIRQESGKKGGNPRLVNQKPNQAAKQKSTPSFSSSFSSSKQDSRGDSSSLIVSGKNDAITPAKIETENILPEAWAPPDRIDDRLRMAGLQPHTPAQLCAFVAHYREVGKRFRGDNDAAECFVKWCAKDAAYSARAGPRKQTVDDEIERLGKIGGMP